MGIRDVTAQFSGSLKNVCALADLKMNRMLIAIDEWLEESTQQGNDAEQENISELENIDPPERFEPTRVDAAPSLTLDLKTNDIKTIIWCTGFRPDYSWLDVDILDHKGRIKHDGGVANAPGMYIVGLPVLRRRKSSFIHGTEDDVEYLTAHLAGYLNDETAPHLDVAH
jgi:putative flavoprotein involved in K+ transport